MLVTGPDTYSFLQAWCRPDLDPLADGDAVHSLLLDAAGQARRRLPPAARRPTTRGSTATPVSARSSRRRSTRFRIRVKAEIVDRTGELGMLSAHRTRSDDAPSRCRRRVSDRDRRPTVRASTSSGRRDRRAPASVDGCVVVDPVAYEAWRIEQAIPVQPVDVDDTTIPQEAFLERDAVSFTKGCFLGQELVCRIDSRGHVNRFLRRVADIEGDWPPVGAEIVVDGKVVGALTSVAPAGAAHRRARLRAPRGRTAVGGRAPLGRRRSRPIAVVD